MRLEKSVVSEKKERIAKILDAVGRSFRTKVDRKACKGVESNMVDNIIIIMDGTRFIVVS